MLLLHDNQPDQFLLRIQLREGTAHGLDQSGDQTVYKGFLLLEISISVADSPSEDPADHISRFVVGWKLSVCNGECNGPQVIGHHTHGHIGAVIRSV